MVNPYIDMWDDNNITLGWDIGDGKLLTQGGDYRYVENPEQRSVVFLDPTKLQQEQEPKVDGRPVGSLEVASTTGPLANINIPQKPPVPSWFNASQPEQNLRQAEEELNQARVEDAQYGSDGYENKEDGVFNRIKNWGSSVGDYLFGKDKTTAETQVPLTSDAIKTASLNAAARQAIDNLNDRAEEQAKEEQGILGYYGNKLLGKQGQQEWQDFKKDWKERGIGAVTQRANTLLEDMARSPYARFVDPTTVLGGQRTMVNDIDSYFDKRGIGVLRDDLLKQDLVDRQTLLGQARQYANASPEEQAAMDRYMQIRYPNRTVWSLASIKNDEQLMVNEAMSRYDRDPERYGNNKMNALNEVLNEVDPRLRGRLFGSKYADPTTATGFGQQYVADKVKNGMTTPDAIADYRNNTGDYTTPDDVLLGARTAGTYKPHSMEEKLAYDRLKRAEESAVKKFEEETKPSVYKEAEGASINAEYGRALNSVLDEAAANNIHITGGGDVGKALRDFGAEYGLVDTKTGQILGAAKVLSEAIFGNQMANIIANQNSGSISNDERRLFARQALNLGDSEEAVRLRLDLYILNNEIAKKRAEKLASLSGLDPLVQKEEFEKWKVSQYSKTAELVRRVVDAHMGNGFFDAREAEYAKQGGV